MPARKKSAAAKKSSKKVSKKEETTAVEPTVVETKKKTTPRKRKSTKKAADPAPEPVAAEEKPKPKRGRKKKEPEPVVEETVEETAEETAEETTAAPTLTDSFDALLTHITALTNELKLVKKEVTHLRSQFKKEASAQDKKFNTLERAHNKMVEKEEKKRAARKKGGVNKPCEVSSELCAFFGVEEGTKMARCDVTKQIGQYVRDNKLGAGGLNFKIDDGLSKLLGCKKGDVIGYGNLQTHTNKHFVK